MRGPPSLRSLLSQQPLLPTANSPVDGQLTCRRKVMGCWPMAWASPMLARMTSVNGFLIP